MSTHALTSYTCRVLGIVIECNGCKKGTAIKDETNNYNHNTMQLIIETQSLYLSLSLPFLPLVSRCMGRHSCIHVSTLAESITNL